jgi:hypothetical protein
MLHFGRFQQIKIKPLGAGARERRREKKKKKR